MPFENILNLKIKAFFFNSATDYLPYYKNFDIAIDKGASILDVLNRIKAQNSDFSFPNTNIILKINNKLTNSETCVTKIVELMGEEIQIDTASSYRSINGLIINDDDFIKSFNLLAPYASDADKEFYESLYVTHYASETSLYNRQYIGDAILILALKMINDGNAHKKEILAAISDEFNGIRCCEYENNVLEGKEYAEEISELKKMLNLKDTATLCDKFTFSKKSHELEIETLEGENIAIYTGNTSSKELVNALKAQIALVAAHFINFDMSTKLAGQSLMNTHYELAHTKAGKMMLDALDSGADILICTHDSDVTLFQDALVHCEKIVGRDIELKIISVKTFEKLSTVTA